MDRQRRIGQRLDDEVGHYAPVVELAVRPIGVEDAHDPA
jgi:hypothetical protein